MDYGSPGSYVHGLSQARELEWVAHFLLQGIYLTLGLNLCFLHWQDESLPLEPPGSLISLPPLMTCDIGPILQAEVTEVEKS